MSRILKGSASDVKKLHLGEEQDKPEPGSVDRPSFRAFRSPGVISIEESNAKIEAAVAEAKMKAMKEAEAKLKQPLTSAIDNLEGVLDELSSFRRELFKEVEQEVLTLIRRLAKKILLQELKMDPEILTRLVEKALETVEKEKTIQVIYSPEDERVFKGAKPNYLEKLQGKSEIEVLANPQIPAGRALIKTETREVDVSLEEMVDAVLDQLEDANRQPEEPGNDGDKV